MARRKKSNAQASLKLAESEYKRNLKLFRPRPPPRGTWRCGVPRRGSPSPRWAQAEADIDRAKLDVEFTKIQAPITGRISRPW